MKLAPFSRPLIFGDQSPRFVPGILCVFTVALIGGMASVQAQNITWRINGTDYNAGASWVGGVAPGSSNRTVFGLASSRVFASNQKWSNTGTVSGNWSAIPFPRVISGISCADVGSLITPAGAA